MKKGLFIILSVILLGELNAQTTQDQTPQEELKMVIDNYSSLEKFSMEIHYYIYKNHTATVFSEESIGIYQKQGNNLRVVQYGTEIVQNDKYVLVKDDSSEVMVLSKTKKDQNAGFNIEQMLLNYSKVEMLQSKKGGEEVLRLYFKNGLTEYEKMDVYINKKTHFINQLVVYYAKAYDVSEDPKKNDYQKPKIKMVYTKFNSKPVFSEDTFSVSKYIMINKSGKNKLKTKYSSYEFYDQTQQDAKQN